MREGGFQIKAVRPGQSELKLQSVGLVLVNESGQYLVFQEMKPKWKIGKAVNNWSFPWETREGDESDMAVLARILPEEVGEDVVLSSQPRLVTTFEFADSYATFYWAQFRSATSLGGHAMVSGETRNVCWKSPTEVNSLICRVGIGWVLGRLREQGIGQWE